jgi:hypothetical protein
MDIYSKISPYLGTTFAYPSRSSCVYRAVCKKKDIIFQVSAVHDAMVEEYRSDQHKKYISMELRPNAISLSGRWVFDSPSIRLSETVFFCKNHRLVPT